MICRSTGSRPGCATISGASRARSLLRSSRAASPTRPIGSPSAPVPTFSRAGRAGHVCPPPTPATLSSADAVGREYRLMRALSGTGVPVHGLHGLCEDDSVIGSAFYVMEILECRIFWDPRLPGLSAAERGAMFQSMNTVIAALHSIDHTKVGLTDF